MRVLVFAVLAAPYASLFHSGPQNPHFLDSLTVMVLMTWQNEHALQQSGAQICRIGLSTIWYLASASKRSLHDAQI